MSIQRDFPPKYGKGLDSLPVANGPLCSGSRCRCTPCPPSPLARANGRLSLIGTSCSCADTPRPPGCACIVGLPSRGSLIGTSSRCICTPCPPGQCCIAGCWSLIGTSCRCICTPFPPPLWSMDGTWSVIGTQRHYTASTLHRASRRACAWRFRHRAELAARRVALCTRLHALLHVTVRGCASNRATGIGSPHTRHGTTVSVTPALRRSQRNGTRPVGRRRPWPWPALRRSQRNGKTPVGLRRPRPWPWPRLRKRDQRPERLLLMCVPYPCL